MGAKETWRTVTTLPNMLKVFNPYVAGGSVVTTGDEFTKGNNLNLARLFYLGYPFSSSISDRYEYILKVLEICFKNSHS